MFRITLILSLFISALGLNPSQPEIQPNLYLSEFGEGMARNHTARKAGKLKVHLSSSDQQYFKAVFQWDNFTLFGQAATCGTRLSEAEGYIDLEFSGLFDCSGVGGWPENTSSGFLVIARYSKEKNMLQGSYLIEGAGRLPRQNGEFKVNLGKAPFDLGLKGEFPCEAPEQLGAP